MMKVRGIFFFFLWLIFNLSAYAQNQSAVDNEGVELQSCTQKGLKFSFKNASVFEIINDKFNASIISSENMLLEINAVDFADLKCGKTLSAKQFNVILIDNNKNVTYKSKKSGSNKIKIKCSEIAQNSSLTLNVWAKVYGANGNIKIKATLSGRIPEKNYIQTTY